MAFTDLFTGQGGKNAAGQALDTFRGAQTQISNLADITRRYNEDILRAGYGDARDDLGAGYATATDVARRGNTDAMTYLDIGGNNALNRLDVAKAGITGAYRPLGDLAAGYGDVTGLYRDSLGVNGPEGNARARAAFQAGPSYEFALDQGLDAISRRRNAAGAGPGGNVDRDAQIFGQGLANQEYGNWQNRLSPYEQLQLSATGGAAAGNAGAANLDVTAANVLSDQYRGKANLANQGGLTLADLATKYYAGEAGLDTAGAGALTGNMWAGTNPQIQAQLAFAPGMAKTFQDSAAAEMQGNKNLLDLGIKGLTAAAGFGGFPSFGGATVADPTFGGFSRPGVSAASARF